MPASIRMQLLLKAFLIEGAAVPDYLFIEISRAALCGAKLITYLQIELYINTQEAVHSKEFCH